ncbi:MAG: polyphosphate kinase 1 [Verrucomicrobiota bacterium]
MTIAAKQAEAARYLNRELSWLEFNQRVLNEALDPKVPLLERIKFFAITSSNLDEFFEVRVAGIKQRIESGVSERTVDGLTPVELLQAITRRVRRMSEQQFRCWREQLLPAMAEHGIRFLKVRELNKPDLAFVDRFYRSQVHPVITPLAVDPAHPFPHLHNRALNIIVRGETTLNGRAQERLVVVQVPVILPRLLRLPRADLRQDYVPLGSIIGYYLHALLPGTKILGHWHLRVLRNSELYIDEDDAANLLKAVENELHRRRKGDAVRLTVEHGCPPVVRQKLLGELGLAEEDLYIVDGPLNPSRMLAIVEENHAPELRDPPFLPPVSAMVRGQDDLFALIRQKDILLHHPYDSFDTVVQFLQQAAADAKVLAIKQTLYRTGGDPRIVGALMEAARNGKQVTAVVELKARFDEANNVAWAKRLEEAGVHVTYGLVGYKIHAKVTLVVRDEEEGIRRYLHLGTGNYNASTARIYTDISLFTARPDMGEDATNLFNLLTGICQFQGMNKLLLAPFELHTRMLAYIVRETDNARAGLPARIIAKMNSLVDEQVIDALYEASQAGVKVDLIVRGICCLRPGVAGLSETITVRSIVDRFLEHSRIFYFENACQPVMYLGSADWMPRNFFRRIEVVFPIEDGNLRDIIRNEFLELPLRDNQKVNVLQADGSYRRPVLSPGEPSCRSQMEFIARATKGTGPIEAAGLRQKQHPKVKVIRVPPGRL